VTHTELSLLLSGIGIGFELAVAMHFGYEIVDARRDRKRRQADEQLLAEAQRKAAR
jgi:hypothetical protein